MSNKADSTENLITFLRKRDYVMVRELGTGACGKTVLLHDDQIDEHFVCKKYRPMSGIARTELFTNFVREIKLLHKVYHPNVVRVFNYYLYPDNCTGYILMEFIDGDDIYDYLTKNPEKASDVFLQATNGFAHLEQTGILHRDIRRSNLMVTSDGVVKIIDFGFGKQIAGSRDFDKSINLNWWCETPNEFNSSRYDFATEVYFVGKLFEKILQDNSISNFPYADALRRMCIPNPDERIQTFNSILQELRNKVFSEISFSPADRRTYREFADALCNRISQIKSGAKYFDDFIKIQRQLEDVFKKCELEQTVPDCAIIIRCFIDGSYYYQKKGFPVSVVQKFLDLIHNCSAERAKILLANLHTRFDAIPKYEEPNPDEIPF